MKKTLKSPNTQEGTGNAGESLGVSTVAPAATVDTSSPLVSGGATRRTQSKLMEESSKDHDRGIFAVPRSMEVSEEDNVSVCSAVSEMSASSAASNATRAKKRGRRAGALEDTEIPMPKRALRSSTRGREKEGSDISRAKETYPRLEELASEMKAQPTADLGARIAESLESVEDVADRSKNLKGSFVHSLRIAARTVKAAADEIALRALGSSSEKLEAENAALRSRITSMEESLSRVTRELEELRRHNQGRATQNRVPAVKQNTTLSLAEIGTLLDQRLAAFRAEIFPDRAIRPPLQGRAQTAAMSASVNIKDSDVLDENVNRTKKRKPRKKNSSTQALPTAQTYQMVQGSSAGQSTGKHTVETSGDNQTPAWSQIVGRNKRMTLLGAAKTGPLTQARNQNSPQKAKTKPPRAPKTAAITVTIPAGSNLTYSAVMAAAKQRVKLADIGVTNIRQKRAATGGIIIEVPGIDADLKADKLADKMRTALCDFTDVRIARPIKTGEMRVMDIDESITPEDIAVAVAEAGGCSAAEVKVGQIRLPCRSLGTAWVKCPLTAVRKIAVATTARITIGGWHSARVQILKARPLQCYKCLKIGHVKAQCPNEEDRSSRCYACGQPGHTARACPGTTFTCPVCSDYGLPAGHRLGSKKCTPPKTKRSRVKQGPASTNAESVANTGPDNERPEGEMEVENSIT